MAVNVSLNSSGSITLTISQLTFHSLIQMLACRNIANRGRLGHYAKHSSNSTLLNKNVLVDWLLFYMELLFKISPTK